MSGEGSEGGVVVRTRAGLRFVPARWARTALDAPRLSRVPGAPFGIVWFEGRVVPVLAFEGTGPLEEVGESGGEESAGVLLCEFEGRWFGLAGLRLIKSGVFPAEGGRVRYSGEVLDTIDLESLIHTVEGSASAGPASERETP